MPKQTKIERMELYADMYRELEPYKDELYKAQKSKTVVGLSLKDFDALKPIYKEYYPDAQTNWNCSACAFKMVNRLANLMKKYERN